MIVIKESSEKLKGQWIETYFGSLIGFVSNGGERITLNLLTVVLQVLLVQQLYEISVKTQILRLLSTCSAF